MKAILGIIFLCLYFFVFPSIFVAASEGEPDCPISSEARILIEDVAEKFLDDAVFVGVYTNMSHFEFGFAYTLPGIKKATRGFGILAERCTAAKSFVPFCNSDSPEDPNDSFYKTHDYCGLLGCEGAGIYTSEVYWTMRPKKLPGDRHPFEYTTLRLPGEARYNANPNILWRIDTTVPGKATLAASIYRHFTVSLTNGKRLNLTHTGTVTITKEGDEITSIVLHLVFPGLKSGEGPITIDAATYDGEEPVNGTVSLGGRRLGTINTSPGSLSKLIWDASCDG